MNLKQPSSPKKGKEKGKVLIFNLWLHFGGKKYINFT